MRTNHMNLVVLHELETARAAVQQALGSADTTEIPGLRRALEIIDSTARNDEDLKIRWARQRLAEAGVPAGDAGPRAVRELRKAVPGLGLAEAVELVQLAAKR